MHRFLSRSCLVGAAVALAACEQVSAAAPANVPVTPATHASFLIDSGPHAVDCNTCHGGFTSFKQFTCFNCHGHEQPATDAIHGGMPGYGYASAACFSCHGSASGGGGADGGTGTGAAPAGLVRDPSHDVQVQALVPAYSATSIASVSPQAESLPMPMDHVSAQVGGVALAACANCHTGAAQGVWFPGTLHSALANLAVPQPSGCTDCHSGSRPTGFVGPLAAAPARAPASGEMKHDAVLWSNGAPTATPAVPKECALCHQTPSATLDARWSTGAAGSPRPQLHSSLTAAAQAQPGSCLDCHANSRPAGVLTSQNAALPASLQFDHGAPAALGDCNACHGSGPSAWTSWQGGRYHVAGSATPATCLPCHAGERPASTSGWKSATYAQSPFDYVTNAQGITHGDAQDCARCHAGFSDWTGGRFTHGPLTASGTSCIACHSTQRPDLQPGASAAQVAAVLGFDHSLNGTGDCFGCHQATVAAGRYQSYGTPATAKNGGDWQGGQSYPGATLVGAPDENVTVTELTLVRGGSGGLITGVTSTTATLFNEMLHVSAAVPSQISPGPASAPDNTRCWHCHTNTNGTVTAYAEGSFHDSLAGFKATPGGAVSALPQPTSRCADCHLQMRPIGVVQGTGSDLISMDHSAQFTSAVTIGGVQVSGVPGLDCSTCHHGPGSTWTDGAFHKNIAGAAPRDCALCHYPLLADAARSDVTSGKEFAMKHRSAQVTLQACQACHAGALANATTAAPAAALWKGGALHASLAAQPAACLDCHAVSTPGVTQGSVTYALPAGGTSSNGGQWMNHAAAGVAGKECAACHAADASASLSAWNKATAFHAAVPSATVCSACHGTGNGSIAIGTGNNLPVGLTSSTTVTTAAGSAGTGVPAGTLDQIDHSDVNVTGHDCSFCHTQQGPSTASGVKGKEWAQARLHAAFGASTTLVMNGTTGRCSHCHLNVKPGSGYSAFDHSAFGNASGSQDCVSCHSWPGNGGAAAPDWKGAGGMPQSISVGGFPIPKPPAANTTTVQGGIANLPHPAVPSGASCTTCHASAAGGKNAKGYVHGPAVVNNCNACHEAGTNLIGAAWNGATSQSSGAGDGRPYTLTSVVASYRGGTITSRTPNHFYPVECSQCHVAPGGTATPTTGSAWTSAWTFPHNKSSMSNPSTCNFCH